MTRQPLPAPPADSARPRAAGAAIGAAAAAPGEGRVRGTLGPDVSPVAAPALRRRESAVRNLPLRTRRAVRARGLAERWRPCGMSRR